MDLNLNLLRSSLFQLCKSILYTLRAYKAYTCTKSLGRTYDLIIGANLAQLTKEAERRLLYRRKYEKTIPYKSIDAITLPASEI